MKRIEKEACRLIEGDEPFVMATILSQSGSTPRLPGTKMIIREGGAIIGTIGGGLVEAEVMSGASDLLKRGGAVVQSFNLDQAAVSNSMDMICGGEMQVLMEVILPSPEVREMFEAFLDCIGRGQKAVLAADITEIDENGGTVIRSLYMEDGKQFGEPHIPESAMKTLLDLTRKERSPSIIHAEGRSYLAEPAFSSGTVFLMGAGHVSRQVARITEMVDFRTVVMDDRAEFANRERFETADQVIVLPDFENCFSGLSIGEDSYIVILTRGHNHDQSVLEQALKTDAGYVGMIGSSRKRNTIYGSMVKKGFSEEQLKEVYSPIGITIGGETPEEIAVSIAAELIKKRSGK